MCFDSFYNSIKVINSVKIIEYYDYIGFNILYILSQNNYIDWIYYSPFYSKICRNIEISCDIHIKDIQSFLHKLLNFNQIFVLNVERLLNLIFVNKISISHLIDLSIIFHYIKQYLNSEL